MSEWQPIETAPPGNDWLWCYWPSGAILVEGGGPAFRQAKRGESYEGDEIWMDIDGEWHDPPTRWMPLPSPPEQASA